MIRIIKSFGFVLFMLALTSPLFSQSDYYWTKIYNCKDQPFNEIQQLAKDNSGNIYITGYSVGNVTGYDFVTIKYNSAYQMQWLARYDDNHRHDQTASVSVDDSGNVFVTGFTIRYISSTNYSYDFVTVKYDKNGAQKWAYVYDNLDKDDRGLSIACDKYGNVYSAGVSNGLLKVFKFNTSGIILWSNSYFPCGYYPGMKINLDNAGNILIGNTSTNTSTGGDYCVVKLNPQGSIIWRREYSGYSTYYDYLYDLKIDKKDNIYVTGNTIKYINSNTVSCGTTIKYDSSGNQKWITFDTNSYLHSVAFDSLGNTYVTGDSSFNYSRLIAIKFNINGGKVWKNTYSCSNYGDYGNSIIVDNNLNVFVTGSSDKLVGDVVLYNMDVVTFKYNNNGSLIWLQRYNDPANGGDEGKFATMDNLNNIVIAGRIAGSNYGIWKYNQTGNLIDSGYYAGPSMNEVGKFVNVSNKFNVYTAGYLLENESAYNFILLKYDRKGVLKNLVTYNGNVNDTDYLNVSSLDFSENSYLAGASKGIGSNYDYLVVKYDSNCAKQWETRYNGTGNGYDEISSILNDSSGNIYVTGKSKGISTDFDITTIKYNPGGTQLWNKRYEGNGYDAANAMGIDKFRNTYVTGTSFTDTSGQDIILIKYDVNGNLSWVKKYNGQGTGIDEAFSLNIDKNNYIYITGKSFLNSSGFDIVTLKYDVAGNLIWQKKFTNSGNNEDIPSCIKTDIDGFVYVTGYSYDPLTNYDYITLKYDTSGILNWARRYNGTGNGIDKAKSLVVDNQKNVFVTGQSIGVNSNYDITSLKYSSNGDSLIVRRYNGSINGIDYPQYMTMDSLQNIYIAGTTDYNFNSNSYNNSGPAIVTFKYANSTLSEVLSNSVEILPGTFALKQNFPNPFNPVTEISFELPMPSNVSLIIYDILGREITKLINNEFKTAGIYNIQFNGQNLASGIYLYRITAKNSASEFTKTLKMMLIK